MRQSRAVVAALLVTVLAGCAAAQPASPVGPATTDDLTPAAMALITMSGSFYADRHLLDRAELALTRQCMSRAGFTYDDARAGLEYAGTDEQWRPDLAERRAVGYGIGASMSTSDGNGGNTDPRTRTPAYQQALFGPATAYLSTRLASDRVVQFPSQGCVAASRADLYGGAAAAVVVFYAPQDAYIQSYLQAVKAPAYLDAVARWSACMRERGHRYGSPDQARAAVAARYRSQGAAARPYEIAVAVADGGCAITTGMPAAVEMLLRRYAAELPVAQRRQLNEVARVRVIAVRRARALSTMQVPPLIADRRFAGARTGRTGQRVGGVIRRGSSRFGPRPHREWGCTRLRGPCRRRGVNPRRG